VVISRQDGVVLSFSSLWKIEEDKSRRVSLYRMHRESEATIYRCHRFETLLEGAWRGRVEEVTTVLRRCFTLFQYLLTTSSYCHTIYCLKPRQFQSLPISLRLPIPNATILLIFSTFGPRYSKLGRLIALSPKSPTNSITSNYVRQRA
jgi:hypothetical protein